MLPANRKCIGGSNPTETKLLHLLAKVVLKFAALTQTISVEFRNDRLTHICSILQR